MKSRAERLKQKFRKGQVVKASDCAVLVTGPGDKKAGYPVFAGVVIMDITDVEDFGWRVGTYSNTWSKEAFTKSELKMEDIVKPQAL